MSAYFETVKKLQAAARRCSLKNLRLKFNKIYKKAPAPKFLFWWSCKLEACNFIKNRLQHRCFPVDFEKFSATHILKNSYGRLLLKNYFLLILQLNCFMCDTYGIKLSHVFEIPDISNENLVFQSKYLVFPSKTLDFDRNTRYQNKKLQNTRFFTPWIWNTSKKVWNPGLLVDFMYAF